jgi:hypothetical protein
LFGAAPGALAAVRSVRLEYHQGRRDELITCMKRHSFQPSYLTTGTESGGIAWFSRAATK